MTEKKIAVSTPFIRKLSSRPVTFICQFHEGGPTEVTEDRFPGPKPKVCSNVGCVYRYKTWRSENIMKRRAERKQQEV